MRKTLGTLISLAITSHFLSVPALADAAATPSPATTMAPATFTAPVSTSDEGTVNGDAAIKSIGPLHMSEGKVVMQNNQMFVLSSAADAKEEAELSGAIIKPRITEDSHGRTVDGIALFTGGFSLPIIDDEHIKDSIKCSDGSERIGRIVDATPKMLHIKTAQGMQVIPARYITEIKSPRAFAFSLPIASTEPAAPSGPAPSAASSPQKPYRGVTMISFSSTYATDPNNAPAPTQVKLLRAQLTARHPAKKAATLAAVGAGLAACFAIPLGIAVTCRRPSPGQ